MDSIKFNVFQHFIFVLVFLNNSSLFPLDENDNDTAPQSENDNKPSQKLLDRMRDRIALYLKIKRQKHTYLIWLLFDFSVGFILLFRVLQYGFGSDELILRMNQLNSMGDIFLYYRYSRMINKVLALLVFETYSIRFRNIRKTMVARNLSGHNDFIAETVTYLNSLKLTLRAWLYIMGLTDVVHCKDKVHYKRYKCSGRLDVSDGKYMKIDRSNLCILSKCELERNLYGCDLVEPMGIGSKASNLHKKLAHSTTLETETELFNFDDDFREINYQLKIPNELSKTGTTHKMDMVTLRLMSYIANGFTLFMMLQATVFARASIFIELYNCHCSLILFLNQRLIPYMLFVFAVFSCLSCSLDLGKFLVDCVVCCNKAEHTVIFALKLVQLYWCHRKQGRSIVKMGKFRANTRGKNYDAVEEEKSPTDIDIIFNGETKRKSLEEESLKRANQLVDSMIEKNEQNLIDLSKKIDRLIKMIMALRWNLDDLKKSYTFYLHMELIFRMPCVMLTVAELMKLKNLDGLQLQVIHCLFASYWIPLAMVSFFAALIHVKVSADINLWWEHLI